MICDKCGTSNPENGRFCNHCGNPIQQNDINPDPVEQKSRSNRGPVVGMRPLFNSGTSQSNNLPTDNQQGSYTQNQPNSPKNDWQNENTFKPIPTNPQLSQKPSGTTPPPRSAVEPHMITNNNNYPNGIDKTRPVTTNSYNSKKLLRLTPIFALGIIVLFFLLSQNFIRTNKVNPVYLPTQAKIEQSSTTIPSKTIPTLSAITASTQDLIQVQPTVAEITPIDSNPTLATFAFGYNLEFMLTYDKNFWKTGKSGNFNTLELINSSDCIISHNYGMGAPEWWKRNISQETIGSYNFRVEQWTDTNTNKVVLVTYNVDEINLSIAIKPGTDTNICLDAARDVMNYSVNNDFGPIK